jgi:hypothetical protein
MWARIDDGMPDHPKLARLGTLKPLAGWLHVCGICYAARYLTDGFIPTAQVAALTRFDHVGYETGGVPGMFSVGEDADPEKLAAALVEVGMWHRTRGGYLIHDFLDYNPSRAVTLAKRYSNAERVRKFRSQRQEDTPRNAVGNTLPDASRTRTRTPKKKNPPLSPRAVDNSPGARPTRGPDRSSLDRDQIPGDGDPPGQLPAPAVSPNGSGPLAGAVAGLMARLRPVDTLPLGALEEL